MFISVLELLKIGIGPSSSHTMGPMLAAGRFRALIKERRGCQADQETLHLRCTLKGSLAYTGKGHATDRAVILGLHGYTPGNLARRDIDALMRDLGGRKNLQIDDITVNFNAGQDIDFDLGEALPEHPNGLIFELLSDNRLLLSETYFSIGGGFIHTRDELQSASASATSADCPYPFDSAASMLALATAEGMSIAAMKRANEVATLGKQKLERGLDAIWEAMRDCVEAGIAAEGTLPGGLEVKRRAKDLHQQIMNDEHSPTINDWLCAYAMAVNEENAAGHMVVTAPTNGAAGVIPATLYYCVQHKNISRELIHDYLLTAAAIGGIIKHRSSISGAEVGCQGEVGSASAMAAAGICAILGGSPHQIENAAEIALEHHLGMTCDPVAGLVQIPCIERNGFGAIKAYTAASLALRGSGQHMMPLDNCIAAMKQTGLEMSHKYKETSLGGLAVKFIEC